MKILCRYILAVMGGLGMMNMYFCRINLSVAMVAMVGVSNNTDNTNDTVNRCSSEQNNGEDDSKVQEGEFDWSKDKQGLLTGAYYYSYTVGQVGKLSKSKQIWSGIRIFNLTLTRQICPTKEIGYIVYMFALYATKMGSRDSGETKVDPHWVQDPPWSFNGP